MGGTTNVTPEGFNKRQWKNLDPVVKKACENNVNFKDGVLRALERGLTIDQINEFYSTGAGASTVKGLAVERTEEGKVKPPPENSAELMYNKDFREVATAQWQEYFKDRYTNNKEEARHDMIRILHHKEVQQLQKTFVDLWAATDSTDPGKRLAAIRLKMKYVSENEAKHKQVEAEAQKFIDQYKDKLDDPALVSKYKLAFAPETAKQGAKSNTTDIHLTKLTMEDLKALAQFEAVNNIPMTLDELGMACEELAIDAIADRNLNAGIIEANGYKEQIKQIRQQNAKIPAIVELTERYEREALGIERQMENADDAKKAELSKELELIKKKYNEDCEAALPDDAKKQIQKLQEKASKVADKTSSKEAEWLDKNLDKLAELAADAQVAIDLQKYKYTKTPAPDFAQLDDDVKALVQQNPALFCDEVTDPNDEKLVHVQTATGKKYVFNPMKFKEHMLACSQTGKTSGENQTKQDGLDYFCDLQEVDLNYKGIVYGSLGDDKEVKRKVLKKAMEAAGITTEVDKTAQKRFAHVLKSAGIGALSGAGAVLASDLIATMRTCEFTEKIYELAQLTKMIPFEVVDEIRISEHLSGNDAHYEGTGILHVTGDDATYSGTGSIRVTGDDATYSGSGSIRVTGDDATWDAIVPWQAEGVSIHEYLVYDFENGILAGERTATSEVPWSASGEKHVSGSNGKYDTVREYTYEGSDGHYDTYREYAYKGDDGVWHYDYQYNEDRIIKGEVANPDAERELYEQKGEEKRKLHPQFSGLGAYATAAGIGALAGAITGLMTMNKVKDDGLRRDAQVIRVVSQKETRPTPKTPTTPPAQSTQTQSSTIKIVPVKEPDKTIEEEEITTVPVEVKARVIKDGNVYYQGWQTLQKAYGAPNSAHFRNWFRQQFLNGKDIWEIGSTKTGPKTQHFEGKIQYTDKKGKVHNLTFNKEIFANALDFYPVKPPNNGKAPTTGNTKENIKVNIRKEPGSKTFSGSITVKIGDKTYSANTLGHTSEQAVKDALKIDLIKKGLSNDQVDKAIREAKPADSGK